MNKFIVDALRKKYEYQIALSKANIKNYNDGETPASGKYNYTAVDAVGAEIEKLSTAKDNLKTLNSEYPIDKKLQILSE